MRGGVFVTLDGLADERQAEDAAQAALFDRLHRALGPGRINLQGPYPDGRYRLFSPDWTDDQLGAVLAGHQEGG